MADCRFSSSEKNLMDKMKFPSIYSTKVEISKVNLDVFRPWVAKKVTAYLGIEDDIVINMVMAELEKENEPEPKRIQINLTGFLERNTIAFMTELWGLLISAQENYQPGQKGMPAQLVKEKEEEITRINEQLQARARKIAEEQELQRAIDCERERVEKERQLLRESSSPRAGVPPAALGICKAGCQSVGSSSAKIRALEAYIIHQQILASSKMTAVEDIRTVKAGAVARSEAPRPDITAARSIPGLTPWVPGTQGLYPRPVKAGPPGTDQTSFPIWNPCRRGMGRQQAMFATADRILSSAFYVAADVWTKKKGAEWRVAKIFGAFSNAGDFVDQMLRLAPTRCFYEIIREKRACKAYFKLEAEAGAMSVEQGQDMCQRVMHAWEAQIRRRWPQAMVECPQSVKSLVLNGGRQTSNGWKVCYHLIYPWLTFPCNTTILKQEAMALSALSQLQYSTVKGTVRSFVDLAVYSQNRQFRLPLSWKLQDETRTPLHLPGEQQASTFLLACISQIENDTWVVPVEPEMQGATSGGPLPPGRGISPIPRQRPAFSTVNEFEGSTEALQIALVQMLQRAGQPAGQLTVVRGTTTAVTFRWQTTSDRPCSLAQIWRPTNPTHNSNAALVSFDALRAVYLKCLHPECQRLSPGRGLFIGHLQQECTHALADAHISSRARGGNVLAVSNVSRIERTEHDGTNHLGSCTNTLENLPAPLGTGNSGEGGEPSVMLAAVSREPRIEEDVSADHSPHTEHSYSPVAGCLNLKPELCFAKIFSGNQTGEKSPLSAWNVEVGSKGGLLGLADDYDKSALIDVQFAPYPANMEQNGAVQEWVESALFAFPTSEQIFSTVCTGLEVDNQEYATIQGGILNEWEAVEVETHQTVSVEAVATVPAYQWEVLPSSEWFRLPLGSREQVGWELIRAPEGKLSPGDSKSIWRQSEAHRMSSPNLWGSPFTVGSLNVGFRGLRCSLEGVVSLVDQHQPDVLFLSDLRTPRNKIGRLRQELERELGEEWFFWSNISEPPGLPVGIGAVLHSSVARQALQLAVIRPPEVDEEAWAQAVRGRILLLQLSRPELTCTWWLVGLSQHVATDMNGPARRLVLRTLEYLKELAAAKGHRLVVIGNANSAPAGGRWGYPEQSKVWAADQLVAKWVVDSGLKEVLSEPLQATWKACLLSRRSAVDRVWVFPPDLQVSPLSVQWTQAQPVFDHALILVHFPQTEWE